MNAVTVVSVWPMRKEKSDVDLSVVSQDQSCIIDDVMWTVEGKTCMDFFIKPHGQWCRNVPHCKWVLEWTCRLIIFLE
jgi:hypothetical protein